MRGLKRAKRVRMHLAEPHPGVELPSVEGLLVAKRRACWVGRIIEYVIALPELIVAPDAQPLQPEARLIVIPADRVAFYEVTR